MGGVGEVAGAGIPFFTNLKNKTKKTKIKVFDYYVGNFKSKKYQ